MTLSSSCSTICCKMFSRWRDWHQLRKKFVHSLFCGEGRILTMFIHSDKVELLYRFVGNYQKHGNIFLLEMAVNLFLCGFRLFMFCWTRYHMDLKQMLKKNRQNIRQIDKVLIRLPLAKTTKFQTSFKYNAAKSWNTLPRDLRHDQSFTSFNKLRVKNHLNHLS